MDVRFHGLETPTDGLLLREDAYFTTDAREASRNFALDHLAAVVVDEDLVPAGVRLTRVGERSMARHGASALDTDITVHLLAYEGQDLDAQQVLSSAMLMVSLGLATAEQPLEDARFSMPLC